VQIAHPRGIQFAPGEGISRAHGLFLYQGYDPDQDIDAPENRWLVDPDPHGVRVLDADAIEVLNRAGFQGWKLVRADWFSLLDQGFHPTATGNSDSHAADLERAGLPSNLVRCSPCDENAFLDAITGGEVRVTTGPIVDLRVGEAGPGAMVRGAEATVDVTVEAAPWVPVDEVRLVVDGEVAFAEPVTAPRDADGVLRADFQWTISPARDAWVLAEAGVPLDGAPVPVPGPYGIVAPEYVPVGFTNPVRLDVDGDGAWKGNP
jgi:hypothetical protein